jgi:tetratricopeptide (TPR) repeat protein
MRYLSLVPTVLCALSWGSVPEQQVTDVKPPPVAAAVKAAPDKPVSAETRGDVFMARKMYREAIDAYKEIQPPNAISLNKIGIANHQLQDLDSARKYYERSIKLRPNYSEAINNLGTVYYAKKNYGKAIGQYKKALKIAANSASIHSNLGTAYFARKDYKRATEEYEIALKLDPEVFEHRSTQGVLLQERSVQERAKFHFYLAKTYAKAGMNEQALLYMRRSLEEGFKEKSKYMEEPEFAELRKLPEFEVIIKLEPRVL